MRKHWWKFVTVAALTLMGLNFILFAHQPTSYAAVKPATPKLTIQDAQRILQEATPYVHIEKSGVVVVDSSINSHLSAGDVAIVKKYVALYDSLPRHQNLSSYSGISGTSGTSITPNVLGCNQYFYSTSEWWGERVYLNHCMIATLAAIGVGGLIGAFFASLGPVAAVIGLYIGALVFADSNCSSRGAYFDDVFGVYTVNAVC